MLTKFNRAYVARGFSTFHLMNDKFQVKKESRDVVMVEVGVGGLYYLFNGKKKAGQNGEFETVVDDHDADEMLKKVQAQGMVNLDDWRELTAPERAEDRLNYDKWADQQATGPY